MITSLLIANRGEIACRVIKTAKAMGIRTIAVYSDADKTALHVKLADEAVHIGAPPANQSYLLGDKIIEACKATGAEAVHPGYGFLSENAGFAEACKKAGIIFVGPPTNAIQAMGDKITSKKLAAEAGVSTVPGYMGLIADGDEAVKIANEIGYPVMIKASAGGGGKGMRIAWTDAEAREGFDRSKSEAKSSFGDDRIFIEKFIVEPRHIEIQVLADAHGNCIYLGERECSVQRRNQKVLEEAPSPALDEKTRKAMGEQAVALAQAVGYQSAGTVEFIADQQKNFYFLEMNTRLQVEHPVTELVYGLDLVEWMLRVASGEELTIRQKDVKPNGWALESRIYAEDPFRNFLPSIGRLTRYRPPEEMAGDSEVVRVDTGVTEGSEISTFYDPLLAKLITWAPDRKSVCASMANALDSFELEGLGHNIPFLRTVVGQERFVEGRLSTAYIDEEFPDGFTGAVLDDAAMREAAMAAALAQWISARRLSLSLSEDAPRKVEDTARFGVFVDGQRFDIEIDNAAASAFFEVEDFVEPEPGEFGAPFTLRFTDEEQPRPVQFDWRPGDSLAHLYEGAPGSDDPQELGTFKLDPISCGFRVRYCGAELKVDVLLPHVADLMVHMPIKEPPDLSRLLLCPMPGQLVRLDVAEGETVEEGQALAVVEAMKMENVLRAEKRAVISKIAVEVGSSLAVDEIIMEFGEA